MRCLARSRRRSHHRVALEGDLQRREVRVAFVGGVMGPVHDRPILHSPQLRELGEDVAFEALDVHIEGDDLRVGRPH